MIPKAQLLPRRRLLQWQVTLVEEAVGLEEEAVELVEERVEVAVAGCVAPQEAAVSVPVEELAKAGAYESALGVAAVVTVWTGFPQPALASWKAVP